MRSILVLVLLCSCALPAWAAEPVRLTAAVGRVEARAGADGDWRRMPVGTPALEGWRVNTYEWALATLTVDGGFVRLRPNTLITIGPAEAGRPRVLIERGALHAEAVDGPIAVATPFREISQPAGALVVSVDPMGTTLVANHGDKPATIRPIGGQKALTLPPGTGTVSEAGLPPTAPRALLAKPRWATPEGERAVEADGRGTLAAAFEPVEGAVEYRVLIASGPEAQAFAVVPVKGGETALEQNGLDPGLWTLRVAAIDGDGFEGQLSLPLRLSLVDAPPPAAPATPATVAPPPAPAPPVAPPPAPPVAAMRLPPTSDGAAALLHPDLPGVVDEQRQGFGAWFSLGTTHAGRNPHIANDPPRRAHLRATLAGEAHLVDDDLRLTAAYPFELNPGFDLVDAPEARSLHLGAAWRLLRRPAHQLGLAAGVSTWIPLGASADTVTIEPAFDVSLPARPWLTLRTRQGVRVDSGDAGFTGWSAAFAAEAHPWHPLSLGAELGVAAGVRGDDGEGLVTLGLPLLLRGDAVHLGVASYVPLTDAARRALGRYVMGLQVRMLFGPGG